ncbi:TonB family protein [Phyllobacterium sp. UNC302MFCol5.2]|uniref:energy transducer TonB family protein n=1 Tax=Phyllobacterium sp. UNC302MFCol5.2 TaxID=1449065 RepID=UPI0004850347|nr:TonB family protein [Phyllobacterium sp. UNC302MFCol5.2]
MAYALAFRSEPQPVRLAEPPALHLVSDTSLLLSYAHPEEHQQLPGASAMELSPDANAGESLSSTPVPVATSWYRKLLLSCGFHAALALFMVGFIADEVLIAGSQQTMASLLGDGAVDMNSSGEPDQLPDATNVTLISMQAPIPIPVENVEVPPSPAASDAPIETPVPAEAIMPVEPAENVTAVEETPATVAPADALEVLAVQVPSEHGSVAPVTQAADVKTDSVQPVEEPAESPAEATHIVEKTDPAPVQKPVQRTAKIESEAKPAKPSKPLAAQGREGSNERTARVGVADGKSDGDKSSDGNAKGKSTVEGNAAVSNYPGTVTSKLRRALRRQGRLRGELIVSFVVANNGSVSSVAVGRSSGNPAVDRAGIETVRRAAPFPPIPADAKRSSWAFDVPLAFGG